MVAVIVFVDLNVCQQFLSVSLKTHVVWQFVRNANDVSLLLIWPVCIDCFFSIYFIVLIALKKKKTKKTTIKNKKWELWGPPPPKKKKKQKINGNVRKMFFGFCLSSFWM